MTQIKTKLFETELGELDYTPEYIFSNTNIENMNGEVWRWIDGFFGYYMVSNYGRIKSVSRKISIDGLKRIKKGETRITIEKIRRLRLNTGGYAVVKLTKKEKIKMFMIHRLVCCAFIKNHHKKPYVNHKNSNKIDNRVENLEWCTGSENVKHSYSNGFASRAGVKNTAAKLSENDVLNIRKSNKSGLILAKDYKVSHNAIYNVKNRKTWKHI